MTQYFSVFNSDAINKYNMKFTIRALEGSLSQSWQRGVPNHIGHDIHRPVGWALPLGLYFEPGRTRFVGSVLIPDTNEERDTLSSLHQKYINNFHAENTKPFRDELTKILIKHLSGNERYLYTSCASVLDRDLAKRFFRDEFQQADQDGLIPISAVLQHFDPIGPGEFRCKSNGLVLFAHPYFRKSLSRLNNFNRSFLEQFIDLASSNKSKLNLSLAFDGDLVGYAPSYKGRMEFEYWRGPKFNNDISKIPSGVTVHSPLPDDYFRIFNGISRVEFWWESNNSKRTFKVEELKEIPSFGLGEDQFACRYVHSIIDLKDKAVFNHFDGAIRSYTSQEMEGRLTVDIKKAGKLALYTKLFKIDGDLELYLWKSLVTNYYQGNPLVFEYFGETREATLGPTIININSQKSVKQELCPYSLDRGKGVRLMVSYRPFNDVFGEEEREIISFDTFTSGDKTYKIVSSDVIELKKMLERGGAKLSIPSDLEFVAFEDLYLNLPIIRHSKKHFPANLHVTVNSLSLIVNGLCKKDTDHVISFTLAWPTESKEVWLSVIGHKEDARIWLSAFADSVPLSDKEIPEWLELVGKWLLDKYPPSDDTPSLSSMVQPTGVIWFRRSILSQEITWRYYYDEQKALMFELGIPRSNERLAEAVRDHQVRAARAFFVYESKCSVCNGEYEKCVHSKYLDRGVYRIMSKVELAFLFWTDKKA